MVSVRETPDEIEEAAVRWVWRLDREGRTPDLQAELDAWLAGDTRRQGAFLQAEATWAMLDRGQQLADVTPLLPRRRLPGRRAVLFGGGAAAAASLTGVAYIALSRARYGTGLGEIRRVPLKDGSIAAINTESVVEVDLQRDIRRVKLARGEAWFQVAKNPKRPFVVEAGRVRVRAVGTAFSVRRRDTGADVLVSEGIVEAWVEGAEGHRVRVAAGQSAQVADNAAIVEMTAGPSAIDRQLAWRGGKIDLAGETLAQAVAEFNRYNARKLVVADPNLAEERLYGIFRTDDPEGFAKAVKQSLGASLNVENPAQISIGATGG